MKVWRLKKGSDRRFRQGHPWIFTSELAHSSKEIRAGEVVELQDHANHFLAFGYAHPNSQICFRRLSSRAQDRDVLSVSYFKERLKRARELRIQSGWSKISHRWIYAEADGVPGLIVDAFRLVEGIWVVVVQSSTSGIDQALSDLYLALQSFQAELPGLVIVEAPSSKSRLLEGLAVGEKRVVFGNPVDLENAKIILHSELVLVTDLLHGQKTGFFLDQQWNATLLRRLLATRDFENTQPIRVLDICCYVGQWASHVTNELTARGLRVHVTLADSSEGALALAQNNIVNQGGTAELCVGDALKTISELPIGSFDIVICDPPAFVKKRTDLAPGLTAYTKLMREAMRVVVPNGILVVSSCSGLVKGEDWREVLLNASAKVGRTYKILAHGGHGPDHPVRPEFPEGEYLKCDIGQIEYPY